MTCRVPTPYHSQKWRVCPACGLKVRKHKESIEVYSAGVKQLVHRRGNCWRVWQRSAKLKA